MQQITNPFNKALSYYNTMPKRNKKIVLIALGVVGFIALKKVYDIFLRDKLAQAKKNKELAKGIDAEIIKWKIGGLKATYPDSQYMLLANQIHDSMRYLYFAVFRTNTSRRIHLTPIIQIGYVWKILNLKSSQSAAIFFRRHPS